MKPPSPPTCYGCQSPFTDGQPYQSVHADYYSYVDAAKRLTDLDHRYSVELVRYCLSCLVDRVPNGFDFGEPVPSPKKRPSWHQCSYCDYVLRKEDLFFLVQSVENQWSDQQSCMIAHVMHYVVICPKCDGPIDAEAAILSRKEPLE